MIYNISLVQPNFPQGPKELNAYYLPYSVGVLWSYARKDNILANSFLLNQLIFKREDVETTAKILANDNVVGFSCYIWNRNYCYTLAKEIKKHNPNCLIIFGGPEPAITDKKVFAKHSYIDIIVKQEGEKTFAKVLHAYLTDKRYEEIQGLLYNNSGALIDTGFPDRIDLIDEVPSPYLTGVFDKIIEQNPDIEWNSTLETNRGCPYMCTFCDWGSLTYNKVKKFDLERVYNEIEWFGKNKCGFMSITDANFGIFPERDNLIIDKLVEVQQKYGYPYRINIAWAKNQKSQVVAIAKKLMGTVFNNGLTLSVQSLTDKVLENIKRKNLEINKLEEVFNLCAVNSVPVNTELILGLPGEDIDTWKENFYRLYDINQHNGIEVFQAQLLENAEMNLSQRSAYGLETIQVDDYMSGSYFNDDIKESVEVVIATNTMDRNQMIDAEVFSWYMNTFHISGLTQIYSRFLHKYLKESYKDFYEKLFNYLIKEKWFLDEVNTIKDLYNKWMTHGKISTTVFGKVEIHGWNAIHYSMLKLHSEELYDVYMKSIREFIANEYKFLLSDEIYQDLVSFQENYVIRCNNLESYPKKLLFVHNINEYITTDCELADNCPIYSFDFPEDKTQSQSSFLQNIYFSRRRNFGKALVSNLTYSKDFV